MKSMKMSLEPVTACAAGQQFRRLRQPLLKRMNFSEKEIAAATADVPAKAGRICTDETGCR